MAAASSPIRPGSPRSRSTPSTWRGSSGWTTRCAFARASSRARAHGSGTARRVNENTSLKHEKPGILQEAEYCNLYCANCHKTEDTDKMNKLHAKIRILRLERLGLSPEPP